jgi:sec-independent protein translocase protein TatB
MFDFAWSEIVLIGVVALIAIGPKDLPIAMKAVSGVIKKARRMAGEFQTHVDEMVREADLDEVRKQFNEIRSFDIKGTIERAVDADGAIRQTFEGNPLAPAAKWVPPAEFKPLEALPDDEAPTDDKAPAGEPVAAPAPAFIPPEYAVKPAPPPAFIPPGITASGPARSGHLRT